MNNKRIDNPQAFLFFGPSGAGKGTQVELLKGYLENNSDLEIAHLEMGATLRNFVSKGRYAGKRIGSIIENGELLPGSVPAYFMYDFLMNNFRPEMHLFADGVVRTAIQAQSFHEAMNFFEHDDYKIIFINLSDESIKERLLKRGRNDDTEESIQNRINYYKDEVYPLLNLFESFGKEIIEIDGEPDIETVHAEILEKLKFS